MRARGFILIDTKYEFGLDGVLHVIDEVSTLDSSRLCDVEEWKKITPVSPPPWPREGSTQ